MQSMMAGSMAAQAGEDMQMLRQLLDNLIKLSFDQESLMGEFAEVPVNNPKYVELVQQQYKIKEDAEMVEDSLMALAKRNFEISTFVTREITEINKYMDKGIDQLEDRKWKDGNASQQYVMTSMNNLALMLDEVMQQMQQQMSGQMAGNQMCNKPGGKKGGQMKDIGKMQEELNKKLSEMKGESPGGEKSGGKGGMSKELAESAQKQAAIREALRNLADEMGEGGSENAQELKEIMDQMEKTEENLVNKLLDEQMMMRQEEILTRLLEADESERERDQDDKRESNTADEITREIPPALEEYMKKRQAEIDLYKTVPPNLKPYFQKLVDEYINGIGF
jgi:hypothetical protein